MTVSYLDWECKTVKISEIQSLLDDGYEIEVESPDGYVPVNFFVDKGEWEEHVLTLDDGRSVRVNENHLFETVNGWVYAKDLVNDSNVFLTNTGLVGGSVIKTGVMIPIVDINVEHDNHRYYTNGVSSHNTGVGKSLFMCHVAAAALMQSKNVLYITMEMAEERIAERIDANLLGMTMVELEKAERDIYETRIGKLANKTRGKLIIKEYPTAGAHAGHFKLLLEELKIKKDFKPDLIVVDYLNICSSSRVKNTSANSYTIVKSIAEELRGLAQEHDVPILSATQTNREGNASSDIDLTNTSECIFVDETITLRDGSVKKIGDVELGDQVTANDGYKTAMFIHHKKMKDCVKITLKSGKTIIVSKDHVFPTNAGRCSINTGLAVGYKLNSQ